MLELYVRLSNLLRTEKGQGLIEYALIAFLIAIAAVVIMGTVGSQVNMVFDNISKHLPAAS